MKYRITHTTEFIYDAPVSLCYNEARLRLRDLPYQQSMPTLLRINPDPQDIYERLDSFGNRTTYFTIQQPHELLTVTAVSEVLVSATNLLDGTESLSWERARDMLRFERSPELIDAIQFVIDSPMIALEEPLAAYARPSFPPGRPLQEAVHDLMERIYSEFTYDPEFSSIATPLKDVLKHRKGVCQDFAHLAIGCLRSQGLAARYVSGYIETQPPPGQERMVGADASHAWFSVLHPGVGWLDYDPTNNQMPSGRHITVAWGRDFTDVTPLKGVAYGGGEHELKVSVDVMPVNDRTED